MDVGRHIGMDRRDQFEAFLVRPGANISDMSSTSACRSKSISSSSSLPASIFEKSRISLISPSSVSADVRAVRVSAPLGIEGSGRKQLEHSDDTV